VRKLCDKYGILMIADEVMSGFGRTVSGRVITESRSDLLCMAKGLLRLFTIGRVGMRSILPDTLSDKVFLWRTNIQQSSHGMRGGVGDDSGL